MHVTISSLWSLICQNFFLLEWCLYNQKLAHRWITFQWILQLLETTICFWLYAVDSHPITGMMSRVFFNHKWVEHCPYFICSTIKAFLIGIMNGFTEGDKRGCDWKLVVKELDNFSHVEEFKTLQRHVYAHMYDRSKLTVRDWAYNIVSKEPKVPITLHKDVQSLPKVQLLLHRFQCSFEIIKMALFLMPFGVWC